MVRKYFKYGRYFRVTSCENVRNNVPTYSQQMWCLQFCTVWNAPLYKDPTFAGHKVPPEGSEIVIGSVFSGYLAFYMAQSHSTRGITNQKDTRQGESTVYEAFHFENRVGVRQKSKQLFNK